MIVSRKFGVTFNSLMDVKTLTAQWAKVPSDVRDANPSINAQMIAAGGINTVQSGLVSAKEVASDAFKAVQEATEIASASLTGQLTYPALKAAEEGAKVVELVETSVLQSEAGHLFGLVR